MIHSSQIVQASVYSSGGLLNNVTTDLTTITNLKGDSRAGIADQLVLANLHVLHFHRAS